MIHVLSTRGEKADWMKNIRANPDDVYAQAGFRKFHAKAEIVEDSSTRENFWRWFLQKHQKTAKSLIGWDSKRERPSYL